MKGKIKKQSRLLFRSRGFIPLLFFCVVVLVHPILSEKQAKTPKQTHLFFQVLKAVKIMELSEGTRFRLMGHGIQASMYRAVVIRIAYYQQQDKKRIFQCDFWPDDMRKYCSKKSALAILFFPNEKKDVLQEKFNHHFPVKFLFENLVEIKDFPIGVYPFVKLK